MAKTKPQFSRATALSARPVRVPPENMEKKNGKLYLTVRFERPRWQRFLGADVACSRTFGLDAYGQAVYDLCDGETSVQTIMARFAGKHRISIPEAETCVTTFLKTLMNKGLIGMAMQGAEFEKARRAREAKEQTASNA